MYIHIRNDLMIFCIIFSCILLPGCSTQKKSAGSSEKAQKGTILVHCAAAMRKPVSVLSVKFQDSTGVTVELSYDGSNRLLGQIELTRKGDIYIAGDADYINIAREKGLVSDSRTLCYLIPVIMVSKSNPKGITGMNSLTNDGIRIGVGDEKSTAVGKITPDILKAHSIDVDAWKKNVVLSTPTVNDLGNAIKLGTIDAAIVWNATAIDYKDVAETIEIDPLKNIIPEANIAVLACSEKMSISRSFLEFFVSPQSRSFLSESGFTIDKP